MKRTVSVLTAIMICCALIFPVYAAGDFVPSISYKDHPEVIGPAELTDNDGETLEELDSHCLEITPVSGALDTPAEKRTEAEKLLVEVYEQLLDGSMKIPFEEHADDMVIRDLIDASLICGDTHTDPSHVKELAKPGICIKITFDLGVWDETDVQVFTYIDEQWVPAESVVNNGDGTVTCVFEEICPIAFCVRSGSESVPPQTGDILLPRLIFWIVMLVGSFAALVILLIPRHHKRKR